MIHSHVAPQKYLFEINANCMLQLGIEVNHPKYVDKIIHNLTRTIIGLHLKLDQYSNGNSFITHTLDDPPIFEISNYQKNKIDNSRNTLEQLSTIFINNYYVPPTTRLGSIGYNDKQIILNISHSVGDGRYLKYIIDKLNYYLIHNQESNLSNKEIPYFPRESTDIFKNIIEKSPDPKSGWWNQAKVNRVYTKKIKETMKQDKPIKCQYITTRISTNQLKNNKNTNKVHNLTNSLLTSLYIASNVHNYSDSSQFQFTDYISMPVCVDLRRYMNPDKIDYSICNNFSNVTPFSIVSPNDTVSTVGHKIKYDMFRLMKEQRDIGNLKTYLMMDFSKKKKIELNPKNGCGVELTYSGPLHFKEPIVDVWCGHSMNVRSSTISLMGFSIVNEKGKNELVTRLRFPPSVFEEEEARNMARTIEFCLKNISSDCTIKEAIELASKNLK